MILKTAGVLNDFVDYYEKYRNQNQTVQVVNSFIIIEILAFLGFVR